MEPNESFEGEVRSMLVRRYPRDLVLIGAAFGFAAFTWAGWAQAAPPAHATWHILLGALSAAGLALTALSIPVAIRYWRKPTAIDPHTWGFRVYLVVFWTEVVVAAVLAYARSELIGWT